MPLGFRRRPSARRDFKKEKEEQKIPVRFEANAPTPRNTKPSLRASSCRMKKKMNKKKKKKKKQKKNPRCTTKTGPYELRHPCAPPRTSRSRSEQAQRCRTSSTTSPLPPPRRPSL
jgi:hypothetical protein